MEAMPLTRNLAAKEDPFICSVRQMHLGRGASTGFAQRLGLCHDGRIVPDAFGHPAYALVELGEGRLHPIHRAPALRRNQRSWDQLDPLVHRDSGHGMLFKAFDGRSCWCSTGRSERPRQALSNARRRRPGRNRRERTDLDGDDPEKANP